MFNHLRRLSSSKNRKQYRTNAPQSRTPASDRGEIEEFVAIAYQPPKAFVHRKVDSKSSVSNSLHDSRLALSEITRQEQPMPNQSIDSTQSSQDWSWSCALVATTLERLDAENVTLSSQAKINQSSSGKSDEKEHFYNVEEISRWSDTTAGSETSRYSDVTFDGEEEEEEDEDGEEEEEQETFEEKLARHRGFYNAPLMRCLNKDDDDCGLFEALLREIARSNDHDEDYRSLAEIRGFWNGVRESLKEDEEDKKSDKVQPSH